MYSPSQDEFCLLAEQGNLIPVFREILADMETPVSAFRKIDDGRTSFLLESIEGARSGPVIHFWEAGREGSFVAAAATSKLLPMGR
jgi:anthranilate synthase component 1